MNFLLTIAFGASAWLTIATRTGMPVSTTHSLAGALIGAGMMRAGVDGVMWPALAQKVALPLVASPIMALALLLGDPAAASPVHRTRRSLLRLR